MKKGPIIEIETGEATTEEAAPVAQKVVETKAPSTGNYVFELPDVGEGLVEADIIQWLVKEGDVIKADDAYKFAKKGPRNIVFDVINQESVYYDNFDAELSGYFENNQKRLSKVHN